MSEQELQSVTESLNQYKEAMSNIHQRVKNLGLQLLDIEKNKEKQIKRAKRDMKIKIREVLHDKEEISRARDLAIEQLKKAVGKIDEAENQKEELRYQIKDGED